MADRQKRFLRHPKSIPPVAVGIFFILFLFVFQRLGISRGAEERAIETSTTLGRALGDALSPLSFLGKNFADRHALIEENQKLREANQRLLEEIQSLQTFKRENQSLKTLLGASFVRGNLETVRITSITGSSSRRPKEIVYVRGGSDDGISAGDVAIVPEQTLLGTVTQTMRRISVVETVLSSDLKVTVTIGQNRTEGLFEGGIQPIISLISKNAAITPGDLVITSGQDGNLPRGLVVGRIRGISARPAEPFQQAALEFPFALSELETVAILKNPAP